MRTKNKKTAMMLILSILLASLFSTIYVYAQEAAQEGGEAGEGAGLPGAVAKWTIKYIWDTVKKSVNKSIEKIKESFRGRVEEVERSIECRNRHPGWLCYDLAQYECESGQTESGLCPGTLVCANPGGCVERRCESELKNAEFSLDPKKTLRAFYNILNNVVFIGKFVWKDVECNSLRLFIVELLTIFGLIIITSSFSDFIYIGTKWVWEGAKKGYGIIKAIPFAGTLLVILLLISFGRIALYIFLFYLLLEAAMAVSNKIAGERREEVVGSIIVIGVWILFFGLDGIQSAAPFANRGLYAALLAAVMSIALNLSLIRRILGKVPGKEPKTGDKEKDKEDKDTKAQIKLDRELQRTINAKLAKDLDDLISVQEDLFKWKADTKIIEASKTKKEKEIDELKGDIKPEYIFEYPGKRKLAEKAFAELKEEPVSDTLARVLPSRLKGKFNRIRKKREAG